MAKGWLMDVTEKLQEAMDRLNAEQRVAVEHLDGPLLVIAGPGTGKTQLLSLRAANILIKRPVRPGNILCLTFTNTGVDAMRERLIRYLGREGYGIEVYTYHSFAESIRNRYPEYFDRAPGSRSATNFQTTRTIHEILDELSPDNPLFSKPNQNGIRYYLGPLKGFICQLKKAGLTSEDLIKIADQNDATFDYLEQVTDVLEKASVGLPSKNADGQEQVAYEFIVAVDEAFKHADPSLKTEVVNAPSTYTPFIVELHERLHEEIPEGYGSYVEAFKKIRGEFFAGTIKNGKYLADRGMNRKMRAAAAAVALYEAKLAELGLHDYDDMVMDAIQALEEHEELRNKLRDQYEYIQLDEFQDTNDAQMRIVELVAGGGEDRPNLMAVGDDDQAIMKFQGASADGIGAFVREYEPTQIVLKTNYRSVPAIVELSNRIGAEISDRLPGTAEEKVLSSPQEDDGLSHFFRFVYEASEVEYYELARELAKRATTWVDDDHPSIAVLARENKSLQALIPYLKHFGVAFSYKITNDVSQLAPLQSYLSVLRFVDAYARFNPKRARAQLPRIIVSKELGIPADVAFRFALHVNGEHGGDWLGAMDDFGYRRLAKLKEMLLDWATKARTSPIRLLLTEIYQPFRAYYEKQGDTHALLELSAGLQALFHTVEDEMSVGWTNDRAPRLSDFMAMLAQMERFGISVQATLSYGDPKGVQLLTAHGSKGLEFDTVILVDATNDVWYGNGKSGAKLSTSNLRLAVERDSENDHRRLVFVAASRAKSELIVVRAGGAIIQDLEAEGDSEGELVEVDGEPELIDIHEASWQESYTSYPEEARGLLAEAHKVRSLNATLLNHFVKYRSGDTEHEEYLRSNVLALPEAPKSHLEFGNKVHALLERYVAAIPKGDEGALDDVVRSVRNELLAMDYAEPELEGLVQRLDRVVETFLPELRQIITGKTAKVEQKLTAMTPSGVPLYGKIDLMLVDEEQKQITVVDYKSGLPGNVASTPDYARQLRFYKLLLESSETYRDYTVVDAMNLYVEPRRGPDRILHDPVKATLGDEEMEKLYKLVDAVWRRLSEHDYNMSGFERVAEQLRAEGRGSEEELQEAFVEWLAETS